MYPTAAIMFQLFLVWALKGEAAQQNAPIWQFELLSSAGSAFLSGNGLLYFGSLDSDDSYFYSVHPSNGTLAWSFLCDSNSGAIKSMGANKFIYVGIGSGNGDGIYAFDAVSGEYKWDIKVNLVGMVVDPGADRLYWVGDSNIAAVNGSTGSTIWIVDSDDSTSYAPPVLGSNGILYSQFNGSMDARLASDGSRVWSYRYIDYTLFAQFAINSENDLFACMEDSAGDYYLQRINGGTGQVVWSTYLSNCYSAVVDDTLDRVYANQFGGDIFTAFRQDDGAVVWTYDLNSDMTTLPLVAADGTIYFGSESAHIYALNSDGTLKWTSGSETFDSSGSYQPSLAINTEMVFVGGGDQYIRAYSVVNFNPPDPNADPCSDTPCPTSCSDGYPVYSFELDGCTVYCVERPQNGQCQPGGSGCNSSCKDDGDEEEFGTVLIVVVSVCGLIFIAGCAVGIYFLTTWILKARNGAGDNIDLISKL